LIEALGDLRARGLVAAPTGTLFGVPVGAFESRVV